jgi:histidyl-tRNA synthetase
MSKPSIPSGTRDFSPEVVAKRNYIFDTIKKVFQKYGFQPIETPTLENLSTLMGKYGEEGDRLLFKVLNNGDFLKKANTEALETRNSNKLITSICERGLRYDLTVPFARYVVMHQNELVFPFKRYQIQPVWRGDNPQKGRYREFYQCDADVVGSPSLVYEAELIQIYDEVFHNLGLNVVIKINNRKVLQGIAEAASCLDKFVEMTVAIDKLDKIGLERVKAELSERGISESSIQTICKILEVKTLSDLACFTSQSATLLRGVEELKKFHEYFDLKPNKNVIEFDITLARGLNYYTGCIFEVKAKDVTMGSIGGGGRYDDLTGVFGMKNMSGVGISFGADRIYDCLESLNLFPKESTQNLKVLFVGFDDETHRFAFQSLIKVREAGINAEIYPEPAKLKKQMDYANKRDIPYVVLVGSDEMQTSKLTFKTMISGEQKRLTITDIIEELKN